jgi:hypothetical protein
MAMLVAFKPGRLWLMESISTNSLSSIQRRLATRLPRRYGTAPPKLAEPMIRNSRKIWPMETPAGRAMAMVSTGEENAAAASLMSLGLFPVQAIEHARLAKDGAKQSFTSGYGMTWNGVSSFFGFSASRWKRPNFR